MTYKQASRPDVLVKTVSCCRNMLRNKLRTGISCSRLMKQMISAQRRSMSGPTRIQKNTNLRWVVKQQRGWTGFIQIMSIQGKLGTNWTEEKYISWVIIVLAPNVFIGNTARQFWGTRWLTKSLKPKMPWYKSGATNFGAWKAHTQRGECCSLLLSSQSQELTKFGQNLTRGNKIVLSWTEYKNHRDFGFFHNNNSYTTASSVGESRTLRLLQTFLHLLKIWGFLRGSGCGKPWLSEWDARRCDMDISPIRGPRRETLSLPRNYSNYYIPTRCACRRSIRLPL